MDELEKAEQPEATAQEEYDASPELQQMLARSIASGTVWRPRRPRRESS